MRSSSCRIDIAAHAQRLDVDNRLSLRIYFRIADNILRQANIFRNEKNIIDLYVMLLRFSSLISETIPRHRGYRSAPQSKKNALRKQLLNALKELEELKPVVKKKIDESDRKSQVKQSTHLGSSHSLTSSIEFPTNTKQSLTNNLLVKTSWPVAFDAGYESSKTQQQLYTLPLDERFRRFSVSIARPNEETLSKHSILGPNGLRGQWQPSVIDKRVWYPNDIDTTPVEFPRLHQIADSEDTNKVSKDTSSLEFDKSSLELIPVERDDNQKPSAKEQPMILFEATDAPESTIVKQPSPPPVLAEMQDLIPAMPPPSVIEVQGVVDTPSPDGLLPTESPMELHISASMMDTFMRVAISNTVKNLETCGVLAGSLKNRKFYVTALIIPKQESTSDSCQTTNEEEIFEVQDKQSLFPLGWIHTHPTQSCFMSSIDVHTHYSYQVMLPEAVAIVMAPKDSTKTHGIFRLTNPGGMTVIRHCDRRGFHPHEQPADGGPIYRHCTDVYLNPSLKFDVIDLR